MGTVYKILDFEKDSSLLRFFELGFIKGQSVKVVASSPFKKVFLLEISGYILSVRKDMLEKIWVK